jgi:hypothetical protein
MKHVSIFVLSILSTFCYGAASSSNSTTLSSVQTRVRSNSFPPAVRVVGLTAAKKERQEHAAKEATKLAALAQKMRSNSIFFDPKRKDLHYDSKTGRYIIPFAHDFVSEPYLCIERNDQDFLDQMTNIRRDNFFGGGYR